MDTEFLMACIGASLLRGQSPHEIGGALAVLYGPDLAKAVAPQVVSLSQLSVVSLATYVRANQSGGPTLDNPVKLDAPEIVVAPPNHPPKVRRL